MAYIPAQREEPLPPTPNPFQSSGTHQATSEDNAITVAVAAMIQSWAQITISGLVIGGLVWLACRETGLPAFIVGAVGLVVWGFIADHFMDRNQQTAMYHSPAGIAHHELEVKRELGLAGMRLHTLIVLKRLGMLDGQDTDHTLSGG
jgi:hypothetical protein